MGMKMQQYYSNSIGQFNIMLTNGIGVFSELEGRREKVV